MNFARLRPWLVAPAFVAAIAAIALLTLDGMLIAKAIAPRPIHWEER